MTQRLNLPGVLFLLALASAWHVAALAIGSPSFPSFVQVIHAVVTNHAVFALEMSRTLMRAGAGFALALMTMLPLGVVLGRVRTIGDLAEPVIELIRPLPPIAVVPVAMILLGIGDAAKISVIAYGAAFPILINTIEAVRASHPMLSNVARALRLTPAETMRLIDLPAALPQIVAGVRLSVAASVLVAVVAEMMLSTDGMGMFLMRAQERFEIANGLAGLLIIALIALAINTAVLAIERRLLRWHYARLGGGHSPG